MCAGLGDPCHVVARSDWDYFVPASQHPHFGVGRPFDLHGAYTSNHIEQPDHILPGVVGALQLTGTVGRERALMPGKQTCCQLFQPHDKERRYEDEAR